MSQARVESDDSGSESELSEGARAARDRLAPKTQKDYGSSMRGLTKFVLERPQQFSEFIRNGEVVLPVPFFPVRAIIFFIFLVINLGS